MSNHFHLLARVPHRPDGFDVPLEVILSRMERAIGDEAMELVRTQLDLWTHSGLTDVIEEWRQRQVARMFNLSEFVRCVKLRFTRWHNWKHGRRGTIWEERFGSVVVEEEERALWTMAAYIDLNPVRAGMVEDPADYRWSGYAEAMAGKARSRRGRADNRANGMAQSRVRAEVLLRRIALFTRGVMIGSREFVDGWFEANRSTVKGRSQLERKRGSRSLGRPALRGLYSLRDPRN